MRALCLPSRQCAAVPTDTLPAREPVPSKTKLRVQTDESSITIMSPGATVNATAFAGAAKGRVTARAASEARMSFKADSRTPRTWGTLLSRWALVLTIPAANAQAARPASPARVPLRLLVYHVSQDDPKKNTARKLARFELATLFDKVDKVPRGAILLDPFAEQALSPADRLEAEKRGVVALDCSWKLAEQVFPAARERTVPRALPWMLATNPVNFGKPFQLS